MNNTGTKKGIIMK